MNLLKKLFGRKPARVLRPVQEITEERLQEMFGAAPDAPLWRATLAVIDDKIPELANRAIDPKLSDAETKFHLGGAAALIELKDDLLDREARARQMAQEQEEESKRIKEQEV